MTRIEHTKYSNWTVTLAVLVDLIHYFERSQPAITASTSSPSKMASSWENITKQVKYTVLGLKCVTVM